ncbi:hypothetical protein BaRGS_00011445 [Batillaria attramentaria]|uniref:Uncharacterized protein n=1 Tax=Batillaria attramentaria TaxID=370345 RepID=A0ABD0LE11_9CAEN
MIIFCDKKENLNRGRRTVYPPENLSTEATNTSNKHNPACKFMAAREETINPATEYYYPQLSDEREKAMLSHEFAHFILFHWQRVSDQTSPLVRPFPIRYLQG